MVRLSEITTDGLDGSSLLRALRNRWADVDMSALSRQLSHLFPAAAEEMMRQAELALGGQWIYPGTKGQPYPIGHPPLWHVDPVGDDEYVWGLNRMPHWLPLLRAYSSTGDQRYAMPVLEQLSDWMSQCPRPPITEGVSGFNSLGPWRALEAGIRMFDSWPEAARHLVHSELFTPELAERFAVSCYEHGEALAHVGPKLWPDAESNHYLMENLGLLQISELFPEFKASSRWREQAMRELERCAVQQLTPDGGQIEGCPHYHNGCVCWFGLAILIVRRSGGAFSEAFMSRFRKALDYALHATRPTGEGVPWGDSDADRYNVKSTLFGCLAFGEGGWLKTLYELAGEDVVVTEMSNVLWPVLWAVGDLEQLLQRVNASEHASLERVNWQQELKQVSMRSSWQRDAFGVFFACRTPVHNTHAHIDPMSFDLTMGGRPFIVDPGRFTYREDEDRHTFKSAAWHNTLTVNDRSPFEYRGSWAFGPQKEGEIVRVGDAPGLMYAEASHRNYEPAIHSRVVAIAENGYVLVLDRVTGLKASDEVRLYYHFRSALVSWDPLANVALSQDADGRVGTLHAACGAGMFMEGSLLEGSVSERLDVAFDTKRLLLRDAHGVAGTRAYVTLIAPVKESGPLQVESLRIDSYTEGEVRVSVLIGGNPHAFCWDGSGLRMIAAVD